MHATIFHVDLGDETSSRDRWRAGRSLATALAGIHGFIAFLMLETDDGATAGLCVCMDAGALEEARQVAEGWQEARSEHSGSAMRALVTGEVIVQRGF